MTDIEDLLKQAYQAGRARGAVEAIERATQLPSVDADVAFNDDMYFWLDEQCLGKPNINGRKRVEDERTAVRRLLNTLYVEALDTAPRPSMNALHGLYPEVMSFVDQMLAELWDNRGKGDQAGWRSMTLRQAWSEISWHVAKLAAAVRDEDAALMRELTADVANGAMMLFDIVNLHIPEKTRG